MRDEDFWTSFDRDLEAMNDPADQGHPETLAAYSVVIVLIVVAIAAWCLIERWYQ